MQYNDSLKQSNQKMNLAIQQLIVWKVPKTPINYAIAYEFIEGKNSQLIGAINQRNALNKSFDLYYLNEIFNLHILKSTRFDFNSLALLSEALNQISFDCDEISRPSGQLIKEIEHYAKAISSTSKKIAKQAAIAILNLIDDHIQHQKSILRKLEEIKIHSERAKKNLEHLNKKSLVDPITTAFTRQGLNEYFKEIEEKYNDIISGILLCFEADSILSDTKNKLVGDALLAIIIKKIKPYISTSGVISRLDDKQFFIILPQLTLSSAKEVSEKIKCSINKIKLKHEKTNTYLSNIKYNLFVGEIEPTETHDDFVFRMLKLQGAAKLKTTKCLKLGGF